MRYHLAARYARRAELCRYREQLLSIGDTVTSRWLDFRKKPEWSSEIARADCQDLMAADSVIIFTERPNTVLATGGSHVEFGLALAQDKGVIIVGPRENVFHYLLPDSQTFATWNQAFATIKRYVLLQTNVHPKLRHFEHRDNSVHQ
jgi:nucleoside 2-deoxyribosyltransferase